MVEEACLEVRRESAVLPTHFPTERQHLAQLSRGPESQVQMIPMVNTLGDRRRTRRNFKNKKKYVLLKRKEKDMRHMTVFKKQTNNHHHPPHPPHYRIENRCANNK